MEWNEFGRGRPSHFGLQCADSAHLSFDNTADMMRRMHFILQNSRDISVLFSRGLPYSLSFPSTLLPLFLFTFLSLAHSNSLSIEIILELQYCGSNDGLSTRKNHSNFMPNHKSIYLEFLSFFSPSAVALELLGISAILRKPKNVVQENEAEWAKQRPKRT